jgi:hypothetical protein
MSFCREVEFHLDARCRYVILAFGVGRKRKMDTDENVVNEANARTDTKTIHWRDSCHRVRVQRMQRPYEHNPDYSN